MQSIYTCHLEGIKIAFLALGNQKMTVKWVKDRNNSREEDEDS